MINVPVIHGLGSVKSIESKLRRSRGTPSSRAGCHSQSTAKASRAESKENLNSPPEICASLPSSVKPSLRNHLGRLRTPEQDVRR
mmetsp:Transcript_25565/g.35617  ORF Transcript_25565/g.35617 Transcript_25565/m.35617 type:complete len:85 (+) Transcript_25565:251-505(+)